MKTMDKQTTIIALNEAGKLHSAIAAAVVKEFTDGNADDQDFGDSIATVVMDVLKARGLLPVDTAASN